MTRLILFRKRLETEISLKTLFMHWDTRIEPAASGLGEGPVDQKGFKFISCFVIVLS